MNRALGIASCGLALALACHAPSRPAAVPRAKPSGAAEAGAAPRPGAPTVAAPRVLPARYLRSLEYDPNGYDAAAKTATDGDLLLGDLLFHAPSTLGPRAQGLGISCHTCHPNGAAHTTLLIEGMSAHAGSIDLSSSFFRATADDGVDNPINVPSLRGSRYTAPYGHDGRTASLAEFVQDVITLEFDGAPLPADALAALVRYLRELDFLPNRNLDRSSRLSERASPSARRGEIAFATARAGFGGMSCASCHIPTAFFRDGRAHRLATGSPPSPHALDGGYETPSLLGLAETAPYFHDGRAASLQAVIDWFDQSFQLRLSPQERADLSAYLEAVGAVDRTSDDRPLASRLDHTFAYAALLSEHRSRRVWIAAIDALLAALVGEPAAVAARVAEVREHLKRWRRRVTAGEPLAALAPEAVPLRPALARLAADWAGAMSAGASNE